MRLLFCICVLCMALNPLPGAMAQEFMADVAVDAQRMQTQEQQIIKDMERALQQFVGTQQWTRDKFDKMERIECNISLVLDEKSTINRFQANAQIQSRRPVFGTDYMTTVLRFFDNKWQFSYNASDPLIFSENTYSTELTSLVAYYAYIMLALDYDTFAPKGGTPFLERALNIRNNSQDQGGAGWATVGSDSRDRGWLLENLNSPPFEPFRLALYEYHRLGLDVMEQDPEEARRMILGALRKIAGVRKAVPISITISAFFDAKSDELYYIFSQGDLEVRQEAIDLIIELDPTNSNKYKRALKQ